MKNLILATLLTLSTVNVFAKKNAKTVFDGNDSCKAQEWYAKEFTKTTSPDANVNTAIPGLYKYW